MEILDMELTSLTNHGMPSLPLVPAIITRDAASVGEGKVMGECSGDGARTVSREGCMGPRWDRPPIYVQTNAQYRSLDRGALAHSS